MLLLVMEVLTGFSVKATVSSNTSKTGEKITFTAEGVGGKSRIHI